MTQGALAMLGARVSVGLVVHPEGERMPANWPVHVQRLPSAHPFPDESSLIAGRALETLLSDSTTQEVVLALLSGGGSAMIELPIADVSVHTIAALTRALQTAGADIYDLNRVRSVLSRIKGGGLLALAAPARVAALLLSDVVGDNPAVIASGPIVPQATETIEAVQVLERYGLAGNFPEITEALRQCSGLCVSSPAIYAIVGSNSLAARAVQETAQSLGFDAFVVTDHLQGEARDAGRMIAAAAIAGREKNSTPMCLIYGGETTVTVQGCGRGGRNQELALSAACALAGVDHVVIFSFATDGVDGSSAAAGAFATGHTLQTATARGLSAPGSLASNDSATFFEALGDSIVTGPTGTNVNDLAVALVYRAGGSSE
jgi:hydroxypyruvate reductase